LVRRGRLPADSGVGGPAAAPTPSRGAVTLFSKPAVDKVGRIIALDLADASRPGSLSGGV
jgi:glutaminase